MMDAHVMIKMSPKKVYADGRPMFFIPGNVPENVPVIYDSAANTTVWCAGANSLLEAFPNSQRTGYVTSISGFGIHAIKMVPVWKIPSIKITDGRGNLIEIFNLHVAVPESGDTPKFYFMLLLSANVLRRYDVCIRNRRQPPVLEIDGPSKVTYTPYRLKDKNGKLTNILEYDYVLAQQESTKSRESTVKHKRETVKEYKYVCTDRVDYGNRKAEFKIMEISTGNTKSYNYEQIMQVLKSGASIKGLRLTSDGKIQFHGRRGNKSE